MSPAPRIAVVIATKGRPQAVSRLLGLLERQTMAPAIVVISAADPSDLEATLETPLMIERIFGKPGLTAQRNRGLSLVQGSADAIVFFDDDFAPASNWLELCAEIFQSEPEVGGITGAVLRDGAHSNQLSWEEAERLLGEAGPAAPVTPALTERTDLYGCNMAYRLSAIADLRFDERLVMYGWLEDLDFSRTASKRGKLVECKSMMGVHLGLKGGRVSGRKYGYSQVANAWYLYGKQSMSLQEASWLTFKAVAMNGLKQFRSEPYIDRHGRFVGNLIALCHLALRGCRPERAAEL